ILKIMGFWIQLGVSGFRMDAMPFVIASKGAKVKKPIEQYDMLRRFREFLQWRQGDCIILAEANVLPEADLEYFGADGDRMHNDVQLSSQPESVLRPRLGGYRTIGSCVKEDEKTTRDGAVGYVSAQPR